MTSDPPQFVALQGMGGVTPYQPQLRRMPDARKGPVPLFEPIFFGYSALMLGSGITALLAAYNALALRRFGLAIVDLALGLAGLVVSTAAFVLVLGVGIDNPHMVVLTGRLVQIGFGAAIAWTQWRHLRGHGFLDGKTIPLLGSVLVAFGVVLLMPGELYILLLFPVLGLGL